MQLFLNRLINTPLPLRYAMEIGRPDAFRPLVQPYAEAPFLPDNYRDQVDSAISQKRTLQKSLRLFAPLPVNEKPILDSIESLEKNFLSFFRKKNHLSEKKKIKYILNFWNLEFDSIEKNSFEKYLKSLDSKILGKYYKAAIILDFLGKQEFFLDNKFSDYALPFDLFYSGEWICVTATLLTMHLLALVDCQDIEIIDYENHVNLSLDPSSSFVINNGKEFCFIGHDPIFHEPSHIFRILVGNKTHDLNEFNHPLTYALIANNLSHYPTSSKLLQVHLENLIEDNRVLEAITLIERFLLEFPETEGIYAIYINLFEKSYYNFLDYDDSVLERIILFKDILKEKHSNTPFPLFFEAEIYYTIKKYNKALLSYTKSYKIIRDQNLSKEKYSRMLIRLQLMGALAYDTLFVQIDHCVDELIRNPKNDHLILELRMYCDELAKTSFNSARVIFEHNIQKVFQKIRSHKNSAIDFLNILYEQKDYNTIFYLIENLPLHQKRYFWAYRYGIQLENESEEEDQ